MYALAQQDFEDIQSLLHSPRLTYFSDQVILHGGISLKMLKESFTLADEKRISKLLV